MIMEAILFSTVFTAAIGYPYWRIKKWTTKEPVELTNQEVRQSAEYQVWRKSVLKRDGYMCVWCRATKNLEVDHVYPFAYFPELRFDIKNGRTLCAPHHKETITYGTGSKKFYQQIINSK